MFLISFFLLSIYAFFIVKYAIRRKLILSNHLSIVTPNISILVIARNEQPNIYPLFSSLSKQDYISENIELLIFDDSSTDNTLKEIDRLKSMIDFKVRVFNGVDEAIVGKKNAISFLSKKAIGELLLFTDADVIVPLHWVSSTIEHFSNRETVMVCGAVSFKNKNSFFEKLMVLEFSALIQTSLNSIYNAFPFMCNAANMAIRSKDFFALQRELTSVLNSGDDSDLLKAVSKKFGNKSIVSNFSCIVSTDSPVCFMDLINQRIRWAGKTSKKFWKNSFVVALLVFLVSSWVMALFASSLFLSQRWIYLFLFVFLKWILDVLLLLKYKSQFGLFKGWFFYSACLSLFYPLYVVLVALFSLKSTYLWKGRVLR